jgi:metal-sulfur cluster biosynthetic enzyme
MTQELIMSALRQVLDPELGINIVDLGLVYNVEIRGSSAHVNMTMTTPACPLSSYLLDNIEMAIWQKLPEIDNVQVDLVWDPPWHPGLMSEQAKAQLGWVK